MGVFWVILPINPHLPTYVICPFDTVELHREAVAASARKQTGIQVATEEVGGFWADQKVAVVWAQSHCLPTRVRISAIKQTESS